MGLGRASERRICGDTVNGSGFYGIGIGSDFNKAGVSCRDKGYYHAWQTTI